MTWASSKNVTTLIVKYWSSFVIYYLNSIRVYIYDPDYYAALHAVNHCASGTSLQVSVRESWIPSQNKR